MKKIINVSDQIKLDSEQRRSFVKLSAFAGAGVADSAFIPGAALASSVTEEKAEAKQKAIDSLIQQERNKMLKKPEAPKTSTLSSDNEPTLF